MFWGSIGLETGGGGGGSLLRVLERVCGCHREGDGSGVFL